jgi:hypothetical protein
MGPAERAERRCRMPRLWRHSRTVGARLLIWGAPRLDAPVPTGVADVAVLFDGEVPACYWTFYLFSGDVDAGLDPELAFAGQRNGLCGAGAVGALTLRTGVHSGCVSLVVEQLAGPPPLDHRWDEIVEVPFEPAGVTGEIFDWDGDVHAQFDLEPGPHRVRYCATGMNAAFAADTRLDGDPELDRFPLQFWPAPPRPDQILKQTSTSAASWHADTARLPSHEEIVRRRAAQAEEEQRRQQAQKDALRRCHEQWHEQHLWGGPRPAPPLGDLAIAAGVARLDRRLAEALARCAPTQLRAMMLWTVRRAVTSGPRPRRSRSPARSGSRAGFESAQLFGHPLQAVPDHLPVPVVAQRADRGPRLLEVLTSTAEIPQLPIALAQVQVQRRI